MAEIAPGKTVADCAGCLHRDRWANCNVHRDPQRAWKSEPGCLAYRATLEEIRQAEAERVRHLTESYGVKQHEPVIVAARK